MVAIIFSPVVCINIQALVIAVTSQFINRWVYTSTYSEDGSLKGFNMFMLTGLLQIDRQIDREFVRKFKNNVSYKIILELGRHIMKLNTEQENIDA